MGLRKEDHSCTKALSVKVPTAALTGLVREYWGAGGASWASRDFFFSSGKVERSLRGAQGGNRTGETCQAHLGTSLGSHLTQIKGAEHGLVNCVLHRKAKDRMSQQFDLSVR